MLVEDDGDGHHDELPGGDGPVVGQHEHDVGEEEDGEGKEGDEVGGDGERDELEEVLVDGGPEVFVGDGVGAARVLEVDEVQFLWVRAWVPAWLM